MRDKVSRPDREGVVDGGKERITIIDCGRRCSSRGLLRASGSPHALVLYLPHAHTAPGHLASPPPSPLLPLPLAPPPASTTTQRPCLSSRAYPVLSCHPPHPTPLIVRSQARIRPQAPPAPAPYPLRRHPQAHLHPSQLRRPPHPHIRRYPGGPQPRQRGVRPPPPILRPPSARSPPIASLEHLGDQVLGLVVTELLYHLYPYLRVGPSTVCAVRPVRQSAMLTFSPVENEGPCRRQQHPGHHVGTEKNTPRRTVVHRRMLTFSCATDP